MSRSNLQLIGEGSFKDVFSISGNDDLFVAIPRGGLKFKDENLIDLELEKSSLARLDELGMPVVKNYGLTDIEGEPGLLLERIPSVQTSKDIGDEYGGIVTINQHADISRLNERSISDLVKIRDGLEQNDIAVVDFQFLIGNDGSVRVNDPLEVVDYIDEGNIEFINELIRRAQ